MDGLHQSDLAWYLAKHPASALATLVHGGVDYTHAKTTTPSDSFPGMVAQATGGGPGTTGIYYDDTYNAALLPAGTTHCKGVKPGVEVDLTEDLDLDKTSIDAGQGLKNLPGGILSMTGNPTTLINPAALPVDPTTCKPVYPHSYLQVNTIFEVARQAGLRTAWSDKHAAYEILDGPSGTGIQDLFTPEINSDALGYPAGNDWTTDNKATQQYDSYKVQAVLNEIDGYDHSRSHKVGTPAIFGLNLQSVSTAEKLPSSDGLAGGYTAKDVPGPLLQNNLDYVNAEIGALTAEIRKQHLQGSTTIILSAKHGQSPTDPAALTRVDDGPLLDGLDAAWKKLHPAAPALVVHAVDDGRHADLALGPLPGRHRLRQELPAGPERHRHRHRQEPQALHPRRPDQGLRRCRRRPLLRRQAGRRPGPGHLRRRPVRRRLHRRHQEGRRARRRPRRRPRRPAGRLRRRRTRPGRRQRHRPHHPDRPDHPGPARPEPEQAPGRPRGGHQGPARALNNRGAARCHCATSPRSG
ncbi:alkaline phosphatase family protein [Streptacidiphilus sp. PAMC 29251]